MILAVFINSIRLPNVKMTLICYESPFGEPLEAVKAELNEYDIEESPYKFLRVFAFDIYAVGDGYQLEVKVAKY